MPKWRNFTKSGHTDPLFEFSQRQNFKMNIINVYFWKDENKQKEVENGPILKFWVYQWWRIEPNAIQCNQIGQFLKVLSHKFGYKCSPSILGDIFGYSKTSILRKKYYWGNFFKILGYFYSNIWPHWRYYTTFSAESIKPTTFRSKKVIYFSSVAVYVCSNGCDVIWGRCGVGVEQCDQIGRFFHFRQLFEAFGNN